MLVVFRVKSSYVPFRESKLTRLFQGVFCGRGKAFMIVNINQCASTYDETLNVMKFSAVAQQVCHESYGAQVRFLHAAFDSHERSKHIDD